MSLIYQLVFLKGFFFATLIGLVTLNSIQFTFIYRINWKKKSEEAVALSAEENTTETELKSFSNPSFENDDLKPIAEADANKLAETKMAVEGDDEEEENPLKGALFVQIVKRLAMALFFFLLFFASIFLHDLRSFDDIYVQNATNVTILKSTRSYYL